MLEWILVVIALALCAAVVQLYRLRRRDVAAEEEYRSLRFDLDTGAGGEGTGLELSTQDPAPTLEGLATRLEQIAERFEAESTARWQPSALTTSDSALRIPHSPLGTSPTREVVNLQRSGLTVKEIAQRTGRGQQEIELALSLQRARKRGAS